MKSYERAVFAFDHQFEAFNLDAARFCKTAAQTVYSLQPLQFRRAILYCRRKFCSTGLFVGSCAGCAVQLRAHGEAYPATATPPAAGPSGPLTITLDTPARGVAPGQAAVLYDGDLVLGSATIMNTVHAGALLSR